MIALPPQLEDASRSGGNKHDKIIILTSAVMNMIGHYSANSVGDWFEWQT